MAPSPGKAYWEALQQGASEEEAVHAMHLAAGAVRLKDATHPGPIYWALLEMGASHVDAVPIMRLSIPRTEDELQQWRSSLGELLIALGLEQAMAESIIPDMQLLGQGEERCWVYPVKIIWCHGGWKR